MNRAPGIDSVTTGAAPVAPSADGVPLAETLDEATLRRVFPDAPADIAVARDVSSMFRARMRAVGGTRRTGYLTLWILALLGAAGLVATGQLLLGIVLGVVAICVAIWVSVSQHNKASADFFGAYARARGLSLEQDSRISADIPLFSRGDEREWGHILRGTIAGQPAQLGHYTYTEVSTDSEGNRSETDYDFTTLHFPLPAMVAARFDGVYLSPRKLSFGALQDKFSHDRKVELESTEFHKRYTLRVVDTQDDIALFELFSTTFVHRLATELTIYWEQRGDDLVAWRKGHETEAADLDRFCLEAWHVLHRYLEEYR
ncbi:MAG: hypothetical protein JWM86_2891 [Thermoleophilia bacterium]|nr:hypothetical protein [Thermoleophilia bacterium]